MKKVCAVSVAFTLWAIFTMYTNSPIINSQNIIEVEVLVPLIKNVYNTVTLKGTVEEADVSFIKSDNNGIISEVFVEVGDVVTKGQTLGKIEVSQDVTSVFAEISPDKVEEIGEGILSGDIASEEEFHMAIGTDILGFDASFEGHSYIIVSDKSGTVMNAPEEGSTIARGTPIFKISNLDNLSFRAEVPEIFTDSIKEGQVSDITWTGSPDKVYKGTVERIEPFATTSFLGDLQGGGETYIDTVITINSDTTGLRPNYSGYAKIFTDYRQNAMIVPYEAVFQEGSDQYVYTVDTDYSLIKKEIETGYEISEGVEVVSGISGEDIIVSGPLSHEITEDTLVRIVN